MTERSPSRPPPSPQTSEEIAEVIELASELQAAEQERAAAIDLRELGAEVGVAPEFVTQAQAQLARQRERSRVHRWRALAVAVMGSLAVAGGVAAYLDHRSAAEAARPDRPLEGLAIAFDTGRGEVVRHAGSTVEGRGGALRGLAEPLTEESLRDVDVLCLSHARRSPLSDEEISAVERFVERGGGLVVADLGWSWVHDAKRPLGELPANRLGARLGFSFTDEVLDGVLPLEVDAGGPLGDARAWVPGGVTVTGSAARVILRDVRQRPIAGVLTLGRGRIAAFGHPSILDDHPHVLAWAIAFAAGRVEAVAPPR